MIVYRAMILADPNHRRGNEIVRGVLTTEHKRRIYRQAVEGLEESSRAGGSLEEVNAEDEEELDLLEGELC